MHLRVLVGTLLGTVVTVLVEWTKFWYEIGSPSFGTKSVDTIEAIYHKKGESSVSTKVVFLGRFPICIWEIRRKERFVGNLSYRIVWYVYLMVSRAWCTRA